MAVSYGDDFDYARQFLVGSYVLYNGNIILVNDIHGDGLVEFSYFDHPDRWEETALQNIDLSPMPLGYMNMDNKAAFLARVPARQFRQGIREGNLQIYDGGAWRRVMGRLPQAFINTVRGNYPTVDRCFMEIYNNGKESRAFSRKFAIKSGKNKELSPLHYRGNNVGTISPDLNFKLKNKFGFLKESLVEILEKSK